MRGLTSIFGSLVLSLGTAACGVGGIDTGPGGDPNPPGGADAGTDVTPDPTGTNISGDIAASAQWSGTINLTADARIMPGAEITIMPGAELKGAMGVFLSVEGSLLVQGEVGNPVVLGPTEAGWGGFKALAGGSVKLSHVEATKTAIALKCEAGAALCAIEDSQLIGIGKAVEAYGEVTIDRSRIEDMANAGLSLYAGGKLTVTDTYLLQSTHDLVVQSGGDLIVDHTDIGGAMGSYEHCNFHIGSSGSTTVTNSIVGSSIYGLMVGGSGTSTWTGNNFVENNPNQDVLDLGGATNVNMQGNYWDQGAPSPGPGIDTSAPLAAPNPTAGPRI